MIDNAHKLTYEDYMKSVLDGTRVAGRLEKFAVRRHYWDLQSADSRGYYFDEKEAERAISYFHLVLRHSIGQWDGEPFILSPWQQFAVAMIFGWRRAEDHYRRFRKAYVSVARKNGKTTLAGGIAMLCLTRDNPHEAQAQVYCAATTRPQALLLFEECRRMYASSPFLAEQIKHFKSQSVLEFENSYLRPVSTEGGRLDGLNPHLVIKDEIHEWREFHRQAHEKLSTAGASRRQPLEVMISTAGNDTSEIWLEEDGYARDVLSSVESGIIVDDKMFSLIYTIDEADDPFDPEVWPKSNPNIGTCVRLEYLHDQANEAKHKTSAQNSFVRYHANHQTSSREVAFLPEIWSRGNAELPDLDGEPCWIGLDLGRSYDFSAMAAVFPLGDTRYAVKSKSFTCKDGKFNINRSPFREWIRAGDIECHPGDSIDFSAVEEEIARWIQRYHVIEIPFDPTWSKIIAERVGSEWGTPLYEFWQTPRNYNDPMRSFADALRDGRIVHGGDPCLTWQAANLSMDVNPRGEWMPNKRHPDKKVDGMIAMLMAYRRAALDNQGPLRFYEENEVELI